MSEASKTLSEKLFYTKKTVYEAADPAVVEAAMAFAVPYAKYIDEGKTERDAVAYMTDRAVKFGFRPFVRGMEVKALQYLMGHSDAGVTLNVYTHASYQHAADQMVQIKDFQAERAARIAADMCAAS